MSILITGGCGYVGTKLTEAALRRTRHDVTVLDAQWFGNHLQPHPRLTVLKHDLRQIDEIDLAPYDAIFHLANIANDPSVELNPYASWEVNVLATMRLVDRAARQGVAQIVFASSASVYGVKSEPDVTEDLELVPISEYNKTKMVAERVLLSYAEDMCVQIIRPATVCGYSPRMRLDVSVNMLTMQALTREHITVFGGNQTRPNIHIDDITDVYLFMLQHPEHTGIYNAGFENISIMQIAERVLEHAPAKITVSASNDPRSYRVNSDRLLATGFRPKKTVNDAIKELVHKFRSGELKDEERFHNLKWMQREVVR